MAIGFPSHWLTNDRIASTRWNQETRDQVHGLQNRAAAAMVKTKQTLYGPAVGGSPSDPVNILFDKTVYDVSYNGSKMCYGSTFMANVEGWYEVVLGNSWSTTSTFATPATPEKGTRHLAIGKNLGGVWRTDGPFASDYDYGPWQVDGPISPAGFTPLIQPQRVSWVVKMLQGDILEGFCLQDSEFYLLDAPVADGTNPGVITFSVYMTVDWVGRWLS